MSTVSNDSEQTRRALVTGSARGIGRAISEALAEAGHDVIGADVLDQGEGPFVRTVAIDLSDPRACRELMADIDRVDVLVNNAAVFFHKPIEDFTLAEFDTTVAVNLRAPFLLSQAAVKGMTERGWGRIVNIASIGARHGGLSHAAVYSATKGAIVALTKAFARFYGPAGITANAIAPGAVKTFMTEHWTPEDYEKYMPQIPVGRIADPSEIAAAVAFLASDEAAYITGATLDVNGGWVMA